MIVVSIQILARRSRLQRSHDYVLAFTQGVALGYDRSRLQRSGIESILPIQGVALGHDRSRLQRSLPQFI
jgi:hypothetical protein